MKTWFLRLWVILLTVLFFVSLPQCTVTENGWFNWAGPQSALDPKGPLAANQYDIFMVTLWVTGFLLVTVGGALVWAIWRYRERPSDDPKAVPAQSHGNALLEFGLVAASAALLVVIAIPTFGGILLKKQIPGEAEGEEILTIHVNGYQWWWSFEYPDSSFYTANELAIPVGEPVKLVLRTTDVIHSFWVPKLAGKTDLMAGEVNEMWIQADEPAEYWGQCAEYCGDSHAYMLFRVHALEPEAYAAWIEAQQRNTVQQGPRQLPVEAAPAGGLAGSVEQGAELFRAHCANCHSLDPRIQSAGPNLAHFASRSTLAAGWMDNTPENLHRWILEPDAIKPGNFMWKGLYRSNGDLLFAGLEANPMTPEQVDDLVAYVSTLR